VLLAMGEDALHAKASVRLSLGRETTHDEIDRVIAAFRQSLGPLLGLPLESTEGVAA
jgi:cysteine desulfurase